MAEAKKKSKEEQKWETSEEETLEEEEVPEQVHDWLSKIGKKGRATPPKQKAS